MHHYSKDEGLNSARVVVPYIVEVLAPRSVIDVGCGIGTWLSVYLKCGVKQIVGIDGDHVPLDMLHIPEECFITEDLTKSDDSQLRKYDLVNCIEVAEHIAPSKAEKFVNFLISLSDTIVFSAAIPGQMG